MKFKSLFYKAAGTASVLACVSCFSACSNGGGGGSYSSQGTTQTQTVPEDMQITIQDFMSQKKQFTIQNGGMRGAIRAAAVQEVEPTQKITNLPCLLITTDDAHTNIPVNVQLEIPTDMSKATMTLSFYDTTHTEAETVLKLLGVQVDDEIKAFLGVDEVTDEGNEISYTITIVFDPFAGHYYAQCVNLDDSAKTTEIPSGIYYIEPGDTAVTPPTV